MKTLCAALVAVMLVPVATMAADGPIGTWRLIFDFRGSRRISMLKIEEQDGRLKGTLFRQPGEGVEVDQLRVVGGKLEFETSRTRNQQTYTTQYKGQIKGDSIEGTVEFPRRQGTSRWNWTAERSDPAELEIAESRAPVEADIELTEDNYQLWREHILPEKSEMAWAEIPWLSTFKDGILAADAAKKPLLLWTMNGHPLGCT